MVTPRNDEEPPALRPGLPEVPHFLQQAVYDELKQCARRYLARERPGHTLQPTALVHETYLRLVGQDAVTWQNRSAFLALASSMMRRILVDHARAREADKRGGDWERVSVELIEPEHDSDPTELLALDRAIEELAALDPHHARLVDLRFFGGLSNQETADALGVSVATIKRDWVFARAWLFRRLEGTPPPSSDDRLD